MKIYKAIKYRVYPNSKQKILINKTFGACRKLYNLMLQDKIDYYNKNGSLLFCTPAMYKENYPYLREVDSMALCNVQLSLEEAYNNFFKNKSFGFPKFKTLKRDKKSYTTNRISKKKNLDLVDNKYIKLPKVGLVKAKVHRPPESSWVIKSATVSQDRCNNYYVSMLFEVILDNIPTISKTSSNAIGLDFQFQNLFVDSNGNTGNNFSFGNKSKKKLAKELHKLSKKRGYRQGESKSNNFQKQKVRVNKIYKHIANQRLDYMHKLSTEIANQYDIVCVESLNLDEMADKKLKMASFVYDAGYGLFLKLLNHKMIERGKYLVKIDRWYPSSQLCCCCGYQNTQTKDPQIKTWVCPKCQCVHNRDINAATNILNEGLRVLKVS